MTQTWGNPEVQAESIMRSNVWRLRVGHGSWGEASKSQNKASVPLNHVCSKSCCLLFLCIPGLFPAFVFFPHTGGDGDDGGGDDDDGGGGGYREEEEEEEVEKD